MTGVVGAAGSAVTRYVLILSGMLLCRAVRGSCGWARWAVIVAVPVSANSASSLTTVLSRGPTTVESVDSR